MMRSLRISNAVIRVYREAEVELSLRESSPTGVQIDVVVIAHLNVAAFGTCIIK